MSRRTADFLAILCASIWGFGYIASDVVLRSGISPDQLLTGRFIVGGIVLAIVFRKSLFQENIKEILKAGMISGTFLYLAYITQNYGLKFTTPSKNAFLTAIFVIFVPLINWVIKKEKPDNYSIVGVFLSIVGMGFLTLQNGISNVNIGDLLTIAGAFFLSCQIIVTSKYVKKYDVKALTVIQLLAAGILSLIPTLILRDPLVINLKGGLGMLYLTLVSTIIVFVIQNYVQRIVIPTRLAVFFSTEAVFGTFFSVLLLGEILTGKMIFGSTLILVAVIIVETKLEFLRKKNIKTEL